MRRGAKVSLWVVGTLVTLLILIVGGVLVITNTDWGREQVRRRAVAALNGTIHGTVSLGRLDGNLLREARLQNLRIVDSLGMPFLAAREVSTHVSWRSIVRKRLEFTDVAVVSADIVLDRRPGGRWNYDRIFRADTTKKDTTNSGPGFGSWITLKNAKIDGLHLLVRTPWRPDSTLTAHAQDSIVTATLAGKTRNRVEQVPGGYQKIMEFRDVYATLPFARIADPNTKIEQFDVATARAVVLPFLPPGATITDLAGRFLVNPDSAWWNDARVAQPGSRMTASGRYTIASGDMRLHVLGNPLAFSDLRWLYPPLPEQGFGKVDFSMDMTGKTQTYVARNADIQTNGATAQGNFGITLGDSTWFHDTDLRVANLSTSLIEQLAPTVNIPREGVIGGRVAAQGSLRALTLDADVAFADRRSGTSRLAAKGLIGIDSGVVTANDLHLNLHPVQVDLARIARPTLPIGGTLTGTATLDGSTKTELVAVADLAHDDRGAHSAITGRTLVRLGRTPYFDADLNLHPLSLVTVGRFAPAAGLRGAASGPVKARGTLANLALDARLRTTDGGRLAALGTVDLASKEPGYHLALDANLFNANAVLAKAPQTALTATVRADGRGVSPATMDATFAADLHTSQLDSVAVDAATARVRIAGGVATVDSLSAEGAGATLQASGAFGLVAGRDGTLTYHVTADSLAAFNRFLPAADTGVVAARPARVAQARARAAADSAREAERLAVERAALGTATIAQAAKVPDAPPVARDSLSGSVYAAGAVRGNITTFSLRGRAGASNLVAFGNTAHELRTEYAWVNARTPEATMAVGVDADTVSVAGFSLDSTQLRVTYNPTRGDGSVLALVRQLGREEYYARAEYALKLDQKELRLADLALRFDESLWRGTSPSAVRWGARGIEVDSIDLRNGGTGRIFVDGRIPKQGDADLRLTINDFQVADVLDFVQSDVAATGLLSVDAALHGTLADPRVAGTVGVRRATYGGSVVPDLRARLDYANASLGLNAELGRPDSASTTFLTAVGRLPVNLASGATGSRLSRSAPITLDVNSDSLPLELIPRFTDAVADVRGRAALHAQVRGSIDAPQVAGNLSLADGRARILAAGITATRIGGNVRFTRDSVLIDSLVAYSSGPIRLRGGVNIARLSQPGFNLFLTARDAKVLDGDRGRLFASAGLAVQGPYNDVYLSGAVTGVQGVIRLPESTGKELVSSSDPAMFNVVDTAVAGERSLLPAQSPLLSNLRVDVDLNVGRNTWVRRSDVNVEVYSDGPLAVHVNRRTQALTLEGVVASDRGEYDVAGKRFQITRGSATFIGTPDLNPTLQATAEYLVNIPSREALTIQVIVGGTLKAPRISLESDAQPPISQSDLLSYLAFSQSSSSLLPQGGSSASGANPSGGNVVGTAGRLVQQQLAGQAIGQFVQTVQSDIGRSIGADVFRISASDVSTELAQTGKGGNFTGLVTGTNIEYGRFLTPELYVAAQGTPGSIAFQNGANTPIGLTAQRRTAKGFRYDATFEPRYILQEPTLGTQEAKSRGVLGLFVTKEWRF